MEPVDSAKVSIKGILSIKVKGHMMGSLIETNSMLRHLKLPALYVPNSDQPILSTSSLLDKHKPERINVTSHKWKLSGVANDPIQGPVKVGICPTKNLPVSICYRYDGINSSFSALNSVINVTNESNFNLSEPQKELQRWHCRLGHIGYNKVQFIMRMGVLSHTESNKKLHAAASK
jgi:hypothetical protein